LFMLRDSEGGRAHMMAAYKVLIGAANARFEGMRAWEEGMAAVGLGRMDAKQRWR